MLNKVRSHVKVYDFVTTTLYLDLQNSFTKPAKKAKKTVIIKVKSVFIIKIKRLKKTPSKPLKSMLLSLLSQV